MAKRLNKQEKQELKELIDAGLEYGDQDKDDKMDNSTIEKEFPKLSGMLRK